MTRTATTPDGTDACTTENDKYAFASWVRWETENTWLDKHGIEQGHHAGEQKIIGFHATEAAARNNPNVRRFKKSGSVIISGVVPFV